jgi:hypothetical protein
MSTDVNLVLATEDEMRAAGVGYREALAEPITLTVVDPITGQPQPIASWDPEPGAPFPADAVVPPNLDGLKQAYKDGLDADHLRSLAAVLGEANASRAVVPFLIVPPDQYTLGIEVISLAFAARLAALTDDEAALAAPAWSALIHGDDATCERWIAALRAFATQARDQGRRIFAVVTES